MNALSAVLLASVLAVSPDVGRPALNTNVAEVVAFFTRNVDFVWRHGWKGTK